MSAQLSNVLERTERHEEWLSSDEIKQRIIDGVQLQGSFAYEAAINHGVERARTMYDERFGNAAYLSGFHPHDLASQPQSEFTATEIEKMYEQARHDGLALGSLKRLTRTLKHVAGSDAISAAGTEERRALAQWQPGPNSGAAFDEACDILLSGFADTEKPEENPVAREYKKLFQTLSTASEVVDAAAVQEAKIKSVVRHVAESSRSQDTERLDKLRSIAGAIGVKDITIKQPKPQTTGAQPTVRTNATIKGNNTKREVAETPKNSERSVTFLSSVSSAEATDTSGRKWTSAAVVGAIVAGAATATVAGGGAAVAETTPNATTIVITAARPMPTQAAGQQALEAKPQTAVYTVAETSSVTTTPDVSGGFIPDSTTSDAVAVPASASVREAIPATAVSASSAAANYELALDQPVVTTPDVVAPVAP